MTDTADVRESIAQLNTDTGNYVASPERIEATLATIARNAQSGCGASDVLFTDRLCHAVDKILKMLPNDLWLAFLAAAADHGYETPDERSAEHASFSSGECSLTGIEYDCCPCGRHE
jgi:hypothetical protein